MLKWIEHSSPKCECWHLMWKANGMLHDGVRLAIIYNSRDENTGQTIGYWCLKMIGEAFKTFNTPMTTEQAKEQSFGQVRFMIAELMLDAAKMIWG